MNALDLFSGGGGMSLGLRAAGFEVDGVELLPEIAAIQRANGLASVVSDVRDYRPARSYDLVAGGPPCPDFSYAGKRGGTKTARGQLYEQLLRIAREADARACLMENVVGLVTANGGEDLAKVLRGFREHGFSTVRYAVLDAAGYGVPQHRERLIIVGVRAGDFAFPAASMERHSVRDALALRGQYRAGRLPGAKGWQGMRGLDVERPGYTVGTGDNYDLLVPADDVARAEVEAMRARSGRRASARGYRLNVEELRALQGAPEYVLAGKRGDLHYAIGNMVPPPLALELGRAVRVSIDEALRTQRAA